MVQTIATIKYKIQRGTTAAFLAVINGEAFKETLSGYAGFKAYNLVNIEGDAWCEYIFWETMDAAKNAAKAHQASPVNLALLPYFVLTSFETAFLETVVGFKG